MRTLRYYTKSPEVRILCEMLYKLGYNVKVSDSFSLEVDAAVKQFQRNNSLVVDEKAGPKTWQKLYKLSPEIVSQNDKLLSELDLVEFALQFGLELAVAKAVNEVESGGKGFLLASKQWSKFAERYNGAGYRQNKYDLKLEKAYQKYR